MRSPLGLNGALHSAKPSSLCERTRGKWKTMGWTRFAWFLRGGKSIWSRGQTRRKWEPGTFIWITVMQPLNIVLMKKYAIRLRIGICHFWSSVISGRDLYRIIYQPMKCAKALRWLVGAPAWLVGAVCLCTAQARVDLHSHSRVTVEAWWQQVVSCAVHLSKFIVQQTKCLN